MADVITFSCHQCQLPFRVASSNAGRGFQCKNCGTMLTVPSQSTPSAPVIVPAPEVELGAGQQVIRKTDSGRRATVDPTRMITRNSGAHLAVAPAHAPVAGPSSSGKSKTPMLAGIGAVVLVGVVVVVLLATGVIGGTQGPAVVANNLVVAANGSNVPTAKGESEREKILNHLVSPDRTGTSMIDIYRRAVAAKLDRADQASVAREAVSRIETENAQGLTDDTMLDFGEQLEAAEFQTEALRLFAMVARRWQGKTDAPAAYARAQKLRKLEKVDFAAVLSRADEVEQTGVIDAAKALREELLKLSDAAVDGWATATVAARVVELADEIGRHEAEVARLRRDDPFRFVAARSIHQFRTQRVATRNEWGIHIAEPVVVYYARRKDDSDELAQMRYAEAIAGVVQFVKWFRAEFAEPAGLKRMLPLDITDQSLRDQAPVEVLLFEDRTQWRPYLSDVRARVDTSRQSHFTEQGSGRFSYIFEGSETSLVNLMTMLTHHCLETWHPRAKQTRDLPSFQTFAVESTIAAAISLMKRTPVDDDYEFEFFLQDDRWVKQMARWRGPFAVAANGGVDSFGGPGVTLRDLVASSGGKDFVDAFERNIKTYKGWDDDQTRRVVDSMRAPNSPVLNLVAGAYLRGFNMFLWHFKQSGKPKYRKAFLKYLVADMEGKVTAANQLEQFSAAFGLDEAGWKAIEADFLAYQTVP